MAGADAMTRPSFVELAEAYLSLRRSLGFALVTQGRLLLDFARWADQRGHQESLTTELAVSWARSSERGGSANAGRRLTIVRGFARYCAGRDPATEIPPTDLLGASTPRKPPHIYSDAETEDLLRAGCLSVFGARGFEAVVRLSSVGRRLDHGV